MSTVPGSALRDAHRFPRRTSPSRPRRAGLRRLPLDGIAILCRLDIDGHEIPDGRGPVSLLHGGELLEHSLHLKVELLRCDHGRGDFDIPVPIVGQFDRRPKRDLDLDLDPALDIVQRLELRVTAGRSSSSLRISVRAADQVVDDLTSQTCRAYGCFDHRQQGLARPESLQLHVLESLRAVAAPAVIWSSVN